MFLFCFVSFFVLFLFQISISQPTSKGNRGLQLSLLAHRAYLKLICVLKNFSTKMCCLHISHGGFSVIRPLLLVLYTHAEIICNWCSSVIPFYRRCSICIWLLGLRSELVCAHHLEWVECTLAVWVGCVRGQGRKKLIVNR